MMDSSVFQCNIGSFNQRIPNLFVKLYTRAVRASRMATEQRLQDELRETKDALRKAKLELSESRAETERLQAELDDMKAGLKLVYATLGVFRNTGDIVAEPLTVFNKHTDALNARPSSFQTCVCSRVCEYVSKYACRGGQTRRFADGRCYPVDKSFSRRDRCDKALTPLVM